jgi:hypothetical protein
VTPGLLFFGFLEDASHTAAPLLDQVQFPEDTGNNRISDFGDSLFHVLDGHAGKENAGIFNLDAIIEESDAGGGTALGVVSSF